MDPASYARHHGVQSESNKVTVTRVACGEILYRRAVDTYKRDMKFKVNSIRKEQKRLRGCMRDYRRKLRETNKRHEEEEKQAQHLKHGNDVDEQQDTVQSLTIDGENKEKSDHKHLMSVSHQKHDDHHVPLTFNSKPRLSISQAPVHTHLHGQLLGSDSLRVDEKEAEISPDTEHLHTVVDERVGRTLRLGSGRIGAASERGHGLEEDEEDAYSLLSDSSDEGEDDRGQSENIEIVTFKHGRFIRQITPMSLLKMNSAYFTPAGCEENNQETDAEGTEKEGAMTNTDINENPESEDPNNLPSDNAGNQDEVSADTTGAVHNDGHGQERMPPSQAAPLIILPALSHVDKNEVSLPDKMTEESKRQDIGVRDKRRTRRKTGVSFGDLIKLRHSNNPKKLFSLVDRLAENSGVPKTPPREKPISFANDPREQAAMKRRAQVRAAQGGNSSLTTYSSVFYTMKFGYVSEPEVTVPQNANLLSGRSRYSGDDHDTTRSLISHVSYNTSVQPDDSASGVDFTDHSARHADFDLKLPQFLGGHKLTLSEPGVKPRNVLPTDEAASHYDEPIDIVSATNAPPQPKLPRKSLERERRKASILEASRYVNQLRQMGSMQDPAGQSLESLRKRERDLFDRKRKSSSRQDQTTSLPMHQTVAEEKKESWSSAFSRIKLVHTLVDLGHVM